MAAPGLSVIIPSYNKRGVLAETLRALETQTLPIGAFEVLVVDDGSTDGTAEMLADYTSPYPFRWLAQRNEGAAAARNIGATTGLGSVLLFLDADIVASEALLAHHLDFQRSHTSCIMTGRVLPWPPWSRHPAYDAFAAKSFDFGPAPRDLGPGQGLTQQMSLRKNDFLRIGGFDVTLRRAQDIDFSRRAAALGMALCYRPEAVGYHNHILSLDQLVRKERESHAGIVAYLAAQPDALADFPYLLDQWPVNWGADGPMLAASKLARGALATTPARSTLYAACRLAERAWPDPRVMDFLVWKLLGAHQWLGLREGMKRTGWHPDANR